MDEGEARRRIADVLESLDGETKARGHGGKAELADHLGVQRSAVTRLLNQERDLTLEEYFKLPSFFRETAFPLSPETRSHTDHRFAYGFAEETAPLRDGLPIKGELFAEGWLERSKIPGPSRSLLVPADLRFPDDRQAAWIVGDESMEQIAPRGAALICIETQMEQPGDDEIAIVERVRASGAQVQRSARTVERFGGRIALSCNFANPALNIPLIVGGTDDDAEETRFLGKVVGYYGALNPAE